MSKKFIINININNKNNKNNKKIIIIMSRRPSLINSINQIIADINYKITRKLGEGMFSIVKMATHSLTGEKVAIKVLEKTRISKIEDKERINREMAIMKKLHHYNIVKLYQIVENKLTIYLIQEHVQGKEFMEYLTKKGKLVESEACKFYHQIISGLDYLHRCGIAHRDFKPENILLTNDNTILKIS
jgi:5'-AMP-activated protein kinase catalytic alpha subunit